MSRQRLHQIFRTQRRRLTALPDEACIVFGAACGAHAGEVVLAEIGNLDPAYRAVYEELLQPLARFWQSYPASLDPAWLATAALQLEPSLPNEDSDAGVGEPELIWAMGRTFRLRADPKDREANAAGAPESAFQAVAQVRLLVELGDDEPDDEDEFLYEDPVCRRELKFQKRLLDLVEQQKAELPPYDQLVPRAP